MIWSHKNSIFLTKIFIILFCAAYAAVVAACPFLVGLYLASSYTAAGMSPIPFMATIYLCAVPAGIILWKLWKLIGNIGRENIFTDENISCLRWIGCCYPGVIILLPVLGNRLWSDRVYGAADPGD